jgi:hypothetical protein
VDTVGAALDARLRKSETTGKERQTYYFFHKFPLEMYTSEN